MELKKSLQSQFIFAQGKVLPDNLPFFVLDFLARSPPVEQVELCPGQGTIFIKIDFLKDFFQNLNKSLGQLYIFSTAKNL